MRFLFVKYDSSMTSSRQEANEVNRDIREIRAAHASRDGDGVAIQRVAGMQHAGMDPILMIDELRSEHREDFAGGFPPHPHRGMQTLTYMKHGGIVHQDSQGNRGEIRSGGAQWMSAGRGIVHSEMPTQDSAGLHGFQLWVNLPASEKMSEPRYRDVPRDALPHWRGEGAEAFVIAGEWDLPSGVVPGPLVELAERAAVLDLQLDPGARLTLSVPAEENLVGYIYDGGLRDRDRVIPARHLVVTGPGESFELAADAAGAGVLLMRGQPLREPVAHYGPFVMNTMDEIERTLRDYQSGQFP
jgi:redox-sensitive bicupin YhaK (pirin superfamily)